MNSVLRFRLASRERRTDTYTHVYSIGSRWASGVFGRAQVLGVHAEARRRISTKNTKRHEGRKGGGEGGLVAGTHRAGMCCLGVGRGGLAEGVMGARVVAGRASASRFVPLGDVLHGQDRQGRFLAGVFQQACPLPGPNSIVVSSRWTKFGSMPCGRRVSSLRSYIRRLFFARC
jgi:hypothetical protein